MRWSFSSLGIIIMGIFGVFIILLFNEITVSNEQDYYTLKDATEAAMYESIDMAYYRLTGDVKISQEKFVENFTRRFVETSTFGQGNYGIVFYQISEIPAKVSIRIYDKTDAYNIYNSFNGGTYTDTTEATIVNEITGILDYDDENCTKANPCKETLNLISWNYQQNKNTSKKWTINTESLNFNNELINKKLAAGVKVYGRITDVKYLGPVTTAEGLQEREMNQCKWYKGHTSDSTVTSFWNGDECQTTYQKDNKCYTDTYGKDEENNVILKSNKEVSSDSCKNYADNAKCLVKINSASFKFTPDKNFSSLKTDDNKNISLNKDIDVTINYSLDGLTGCSRYEIATNYQVTLEYYFGK